MSEPFHLSEARSTPELRKLHAKFEKYHRAKFETWLALRDKARKDLFWLGTAVLGKNWLEVPHRSMCDFWVKKNFDGVYYEGYTLQDVHNAIARQDETHERIQLCPRGSYKTTIDGVDDVQWLLNVPDIRILNLTGESTLGDAMLREVKNYFYQPKDADPTFFQQLFPEYIITGEQGDNTSPLTCPARKHFQREPSMWVNSITSSLSGWHCDLLKGDDVVTDRNSTTEETRFKINQRYDAAFNLLDEWGFADSVGTRYATDDWYGVRLAIPREDAPLKYMCTSAWTVKPSFRNLPLKSLNADMVDLLFPEKLDFKSLRKKLLKDETLFRAQQLNEPALDSYAVTFDIVDLHAHTIPASKVPAGGQIFFCWDWASTTGVQSDYSAGAVGKICGDSIYVLEIDFGKYSPTELCFALLKMARKWNPIMGAMDDGPGVEFFKRDLQRTAVHYRYSIPPLSWKAIDRGKDAKARRIKGLEVLLKADKLWFVDGPWLHDTFRMFEDFRGINKRGRHDDIPDAVSMLQRFLPKPTSPAEQAVPKTPEEASRETWERQVSMMEAGRYMPSPAPREGSVVSGGPITAQSPPHKGIYIKQ